MWAALGASARAMLYAGLALRCACGGTLAQRGACRGYRRSNAARSDGRGPQCVCAVYKPVMPRTTLGEYHRTSQREVSDTPSRPSSLLPSSPCMHLLSANLVMLTAQLPAVPAIQYKSFCHDEIGVPPSAPAHLHPSSCSCAVAALLLTSFIKHDVHSLSGDTLCTLF